MYILFISVMKARCTKTLSHFFLAKSSGATRKKKIFTSFAFKWLWYLWNHCGGWSCLFMSYFFMAVWPVKPISDLCFLVLLHSFQPAPARWISYGTSWTILILAVSVFMMDWFSFRAFLELWVPFPLLWRVLFIGLIDFAVFTSTSVTGPFENPMVATWTEWPVHSKLISSNL